MKKIRIIIPSLLVVSLTACGGAIEVNIDDYPQSDSKAAQVYVESCSACHVPPRPAVYSRHEWEVIVTRMQQRRVEKHMPRITGDDFELMMDYLQRHARPTV